MVSRKRLSPWVDAWQRNVDLITRLALKNGTRALRQATRTPARSPITRQLTRATQNVVKRSVKRAAGHASEVLAERAQPPAGAGDWLSGVAVAPGGMRRFNLFKPAGVGARERLPLLVMLHGCGQDAKRFAVSTRMNQLAARERFLVLYPEQDGLANPQRCWNWFDTANGRAQLELSLILRAIEQVCLFYPVDAERVAIAGLSAGASMAAMLAGRHPGRFKAVAMHSGVPPGSARSSVSAVGAMAGLPRRRGSHPVMLDQQVLPPLLVIHGGHDTVVAVSNGYVAARTWAEASGASPKPARIVRRGQRRAMSIIDYVRRRRLLARLIDVDRMGHAWSGGAARQPYSDPQGPDASRLIWAFVKRQFAAGAKEAGAKEV